MKQHCPLCNSSGETFYKFKNNHFYICSNCLAIYVAKNKLPDLESEKKRYLKHYNDVNDKKYQKFVSPITTAVRKEFSIRDSGLDFGAGTGSAVSQVLQNYGYSIIEYDPFFHNYPDLLKQKYDFIASCEVIEHFHNPYKEFQLLRSLLKPSGKLFCMTNLYNDNINFHTWYYKNDLTHVIIYQKETIFWIKKMFNFKHVYIEDNLISFYT
jgi:2-polyprenyl-3-methyl-5-hydroxy-6-metoxy-1,4-benzoquinol methylase